MEEFIPLQAVGRDDVNLVGGKAAFLGELMRAGLLVPDGFVVSAKAFRTQRGTPSSAFTVALLTAFDRLGSRHVAVRSSATNEDGHDASWAGQLNTFLYVPRDELLARIQDCWASAYSDRALAYAREHGTEPGHVAIIVQAMVPSTISGVAFSVHPITQNHEHMIIEAGFGLGEAIVSGQITPDTYVVHKASRTIVERHVAPQPKQLVGAKTGHVWQDISGSKRTEQKLADHHIATLAGHVQAIETRLGYPVDVEWALANGKLYITQARPITTLTGML